MQNNWLVSHCTKGVIKQLLMMKFFLLLTLLCSIQVHSKVFAQDKITLSVKNAKFKHALSAIERVSQYRFIYTDDILPQHTEISLSVQDATLSQVLDKLFANTKLTYKVMHDKLIAIGNMDSSIAYLQVRGNIIDSASGQPIAGVSIQVKGTNNGTTSDKNGNFSINAAENAVLLISSVGYNAVEIAATNSFVNISLAPAASGLNQIVIIGYGSREKKAITTSISTINATEISKSITTSSEFAMQGRMPGVYVSGNSGNPMDRPTIRIRGTNTWGVSDPLYVIDGIPVTELGAGIEGTDARIQDMRSPVNIMTLINPDDIESMSVLKDASAAAIYGVRAANGVILITTKKGKAGKPVVSFNARYGVQNVVKKWDVLNTPQYVTFYKNSYAANPAFQLDPWFDPSSPDYLGNSTISADWQTPMINKNASSQDYALQVSGGSEKTDYSFSFGYNRTEGALINQDLKRYSVATKINTQATAWLSFGINYRLAYQDNSALNFGGLSDVANTPPWQPVYATGGPAFLNGYAPAVAGYDANGVWSSAKLYGEATRLNIFGQMSEWYRHYDFLRNLGNAYAELKPLPGLSIRGAVSVDWFRQQRNEFRDYNQNYFDYSAGDPKSRGGGTSMGLYNERNIGNFSLTKELSLTYDKRFGSHRFNLLLNASHQRFYGKYVSGETEYTTTNNPDLLSLGGDNQYTKLESDQFRWALAGLLGRLSYDFASKYYIDLTLRRDGSSRFSPQNRWGTFPAVSAAWRVTSETFMKNAGWLDDLKLRVGWGQLGNQEVRPMAYVSIVSTTPMYAFGSNPGGNGIGNYQTGAAMFSFPNPDLRWERTSTTNIGIDAVLFKNLNITAEYYHKLTDGILQSTSIPPSVGSAENPVANVATVRNSGVEFNIGYSGKLSKDVGYNIGVNLTTVKNEVLKTYNDIPINTSIGRIEKGFPINYLYGYQATGILQSAAEAEAYGQQYADAYATQDHQPGDMTFADLNGAPSGGHRFFTPTPDGKVDDYDRTYLGKTIPGYYYGFNLGLNYKSIDASIFFQGVGDVQKYNTVLMNLEATGTRGNNMLTSVLNAWTASHTNTDMPRAVVGDPNANGRYSSRYVQNAAYLRLGNAQIGYTLPQRINKALGSLQQLRVYASVSNAFLVTQWGGLDPENDINPMPRTFTFGISGRF